MSVYKPMKVASADDRKVYRQENPSLRVIVLTISIESHLIFEACKQETNTYLLRNSEEVIIKTIRGDNKFLGTC